MAIITMKVSVNSYSLPAGFYTWRKKQQQQNQFTLYGPQSIVTFPFFITYTIRIIDPG